MDLTPIQTEFFNSVNLFEKKLPPLSDKNKINFLNSYKEVIEPIWDSVEKFFNLKENEIENLGISYNDKILEINKEHKKIIDEKDKKYNDLEFKLKQLNNDYTKSIEILNNSIKDYENDIQGHINTINLKNSSINELQNNVKAIQSNLEANKTNNNKNMDDAEMKFNNMKNELDNELKKCKLELDECTIKKKELLDDAIENTSVCLNNKFEIDKLKIEKSKLENDYTSLNDKYNDLVTNNNKCALDLKECQTNVSNYAVALNDQIILQLKYNEAVNERKKIENERNGLKVSVQSLSNEKLKLDVENGNNNKKILELEKKIKIYDDTYVSDNTTIKDIEIDKKKIESLNKENKENKETIKELKSTIKYYKKDTEDLKRTVDEEKEKLKKSEDLVNQKNFQIQNFGNVNDFVKKVKDQNQKLRDDNRLLTNNTMLIKFKRDTEEKIKNTNLEKNNIQNELTALKLLNETIENKKRADDLNKCNKEKIEIKTLFDECTKNVSKKANENLDQSNKIKEIESIIKEKENIINEKENELKINRDKIISINKDIESLKYSNSNKEKELNFKDGLIIGKDQIINKLENQVKTNGINAEKFKEFQKLSESAKKKLEEYMTKYNNIETERNKLQLALTEQEEVVKKNQLKIAEYEKNILEGTLTTSSIIANRDKDFDELKEKIKDLNSKNDNIAKELNAKKLKLDDLVKEYEENVDDYNELYDLNEECETELKICEDKTASLTREIADEKSKIITLNNDIKKITDENVVLKVDLGSCNDKLTLKENEFNDNFKLFTSCKYDVNLVKKLNGKYNNALSLFEDDIQVYNIIKSKNTKIEREDIIKDFLSMKRNISDFNSIEYDWFYTRNEARMKKFEPVLRASKVLGIRPKI